MQIKVYNEDGKVRVVKVTNNGIEQIMFSNVADGEVAIIDVEVANLSVQGNLDSISRWINSSMGVLERRFKIWELLVKKK